jgi:hypothetical protein
MHTAAGGSCAISLDCLLAHINNLYDLDEAGWKILAANLRNLSLLYDQLLALFGRDLEADIMGLVLDVQSRMKLGVTPISSQRRCPQLLNN